MDEKKTGFTKILAVAGSILLWFPMLLPLVLAISALIERGRFLFDYLMPGELFFVVLAGGALLIWAALRARYQLKPIGWGFGAALLALGGSMGLALVSGLASGRIGNEGLPFIAVMVLFALYWLALIFVGIAGIRLIRRLFSK